MAKRGVKQKDGEDFSASTIETVIKLLNQEKPITKKEACDRLKINYNTARLGRIIEEYLEHKEFTKTRRKQVRKLPISKTDVKDICSMYLSGEPLNAIVEATFRSTSVVKRLLLQNNIPLRDASHNYQNPVYLSDDSYAEDYVKGDLAYSSRYGSLVEIRGPGKKYKDSIVFPIQITGTYERGGYAEACELADLRKLQKEYGIKPINMSQEEIRYTLNQTMLAANKNKRKQSEF